MSNPLNFLPAPPPEEQELTLLEAAETLLAFYDDFYDQENSKFVLSEHIRKAIEHARYIKNNRSEARDTKEMVLRALKGE